MYEMENTYSVDISLEKAICKIFISCDIFNILFEYGLDMPLYCGTNVFF